MFCQVINVCRFLWTLNIFHFLLTMETKQIVTFPWGKNCQRSRSVDSSCNLFYLYAPEEITISGNELKTINLRTKLILPPNMSERIWLLPSFENNRVHKQNNGIVHSGGWLKMELLNQNFLRKITIAKGDRLAYLFVLNTIGKKINDVNYIKS